MTAHGTVAFTGPGYLFFFYNGLNISETADGEEKGSASLVREVRGEGVDFITKQAGVNDVMALVPVLL